MRVVVSLPLIRSVVCSSLLCYTLGIVVLAVWPLETWTWIEIIVAAVAAVAAVGLILIMLPWVYIRGEEWAYLMTGFAGMVTFFAYETMSDEPTYIKVRMGLMLLAGVIGSFGAHLSKDRLRLAPSS